MKLRVEEISMRPEEFKAWFSGFTEAIGGMPNEKQWERIKEQVGKLTAGLPVHPYQGTFIRNDSVSAFNKAGKQEAQAG
jgi:hypothetical protein